MGPRLLGKVKAGRFFEGFYQLEPPSPETKKDYNYGPPSVDRIYGDLLIICPKPHSIY